MVATASSASFDFGYDDSELFYDIATGSDASVTLATIHNDIQLLTVTILMIYIILFVLFLVKKWR